MKLNSLQVCRREEVLNLSECMTFTDGSKNKKERKKSQLSGAAEERVSLSR